MTVRPAGPQDDAFLVRALALAVDWQPGARVRSSQEVLGSAELARYLPDWSRGRDRGAVAELDAGTAGAAWWRFRTADDPGYGFVSADVPEVCVAVERQHRGRGVGTSLLRELMSSAAKDGLPGLSLSVEQGNVAERLYRRLGFVRVAFDAGAHTMLLSNPSEQTGSPQVEALGSARTSRPH